MELNHTCVEILKILYNEQDYVSIADLSERLGKTERSVRYNLDIVDKYLQQHGLPFTEREFARGIKLKVTPEVSTVLHDYLSVSTPYQYKFSTEERIRYLEICLLLGHKRYTPIADMARQLVVSYGTISTDLAAVEDWMNAHRLTMERKSRMGIRICGSEDLIRTICLDRLNESISLQEYERYLCGNPLENKVSLLIFSELFCELDVSFFRELPKQAESVLCRVFSDDSFGKMIFALAIMTQRRRSGVAGPMVSPSDEELHAPSEEQSAAQSMLDQIGQRYHVTFTEGDRISLTERLLSSKCILSGCATLGRDSRRRKKMASVADQIVANIERLYQISFGEDRQGLVERLMVHLTPTTYRIRFHKSIVNPLYDELVAQHRQLLENTAIAVKPFEDYCGAPIGEHEVSYIALYFLASLNQLQHPNEKRPRVIVACGSGYGTAQVVTSQLKRLFDVDIVSVHSGRNVTEMVLNHTVPYDCIVSTVDLPRLPSSSYIKINPVFDSGDYRKLSQHINAKRLREISGDMLYIANNLVDVVKRYGCVDNLDQMRYEFLSVLTRGSVMQGFPNDAGSPTLMDLLEPRMIRLGVSCRTWEDVIDASTFSLEEYGYVTRNYKTAIRQNILDFGPGMVMFPGTLVAHASPVNGCKRLGFGFMTLAEPVVFNNPNYDPVRIVFTLSVLDSANYMNAIVQLFQMLSEKQFRERLFSVQSKDQVIQIIRDFLNTQT